MNVFEDTKILTVAIVAAALAMTTLYAAYLGYPLNVHDSKYILPVATNYAMNKQLINEFANPLAPKPLTPEGVSEWGRLLMYPPLFPIVISLFISPGSSLAPSEQVQIILGIMDAIAIILVGIASYKFATTEGRKLDWPAVLMISSVMLITLGTVWTFNGKPEALSRLFFALGLLVPFYVKKRWVLIAVFSLLLGLITATHPIGSMFFAPAVGAFLLLWRKNWLYGLYDTIVVSGLGAMIGLLLMQLSPYRVQENVSNMLLVGYQWGAVPFVQLSLDWVLRVIKNSVIAYDRPIYVVYAVLFIFVLYQLYRSRKEIKLHPLFFIPAAVFLLVMLRFLRYRTYYLALFSPLMVAASIYYAVAIAKRRAVKYGVLFVLLILALVSIKPLVLLPFFIKDGATIHAARAEFQETFQANPESYYFISYEVFPLWSRPESYTKVYELQSTDNPDYYGSPITSFRDNGSSGPIIVLGQNDVYFKNIGSMSTVPPESIFGCPLASDRFVKVRPTIFGYKLADAMPGYGFAVYKCT